MRDINLLPESRHNKRIIARNILLIFLAVAFAGIVIYFGIIAPLYEKSIAEQVLRLHMAQMEKFKDADTINTELIARIEEIKAHKEGMAELFEQRLPSSMLVSEIEGALPEGVRLISIVYGDGVVTLQGRAPSPIEVADFSIGLRNTGLFQSVRILSIHGGLADGYHSFNMTLRVTGE